MNERAFLHDVETRLACDARRADAITFAVFQELRNRITPHEAADVAAQLPTALKRMWEAGDRPAQRPERIHKAEFLGRVRQHAVLPDDAEAERAVRAVFGALQRLLGSRTGLEGEAWDIFSQLPKDLKALWVESAGGS